MPVIFLIQFPMLKTNLVHSVANRKNLSRIQTWANWYITRKTAQKREHKTTRTAPVCLLVFLCPRFCAVFLSPNRNNVRVQISTCNSVKKHLVRVLAGFGTCKDILSDFPKRGSAATGTRWGNLSPSWCQILYMHKSHNLHIRRVERFCFFG